jgi:hypothetical protein
MSINDEQCLTYEKFELVFQTTLGSQSSKCVGIDICVANVKANLLAGRRSQSVVKDSWITALSRTEWSGPRPVRQVTKNTATCW